MNVDDTVVVIGGSSGIGLAVARRSLADGATVVIAGRSRQRLDAARAELAQPEQAQAEQAQARPDAVRLSAYPADIGDLAQVTRLFEQVGTLSHLVVTAADLPYGPAVSLSEDSMVRAVRSKILGPLFAAQQPRRGSRRRAASRSPRRRRSRPAPGERWPPRQWRARAMVRALALELAPIRVNAFPRMGGHPRVGPPGHARCQAARMADLAARLPARRLGRPEDIANAVAS